jgi:hypothetical protein
MGTECENSADSCKILRIATFIGRNYAVRILGSLSKRKPRKAHNTANANRVCARGAKGRNHARQRLALKEIDQDRDLVR